MNLGDNLLLQDISSFDRLEAEEALMVMRYMFTKETSYEKQAIFLEYIDKLETLLLEIYATQLDIRLAGHTSTPQLPENMP